MTRALRRVTACITAFLLLAAAPTLARQGATPHGDMPGMTGGASPADQALMAGMARMHQEMNTPLTGDADMDFVRMMIPHHQGAIDMAKVELQYGKDPAIRKLAEAIVAAQENEIAEMQRWQRGR